jgi:acylphosphatase
MVIRQLRIHGKVQGVFFRESMRQKALELNITGWVRNRRDGTVESIIQGNPEAVAKLIDWAHSGPEYAQVVRIEITEAEGYFENFEKKETI